MDELYGGGDLAAVFANGNEHTWTLTLYDTTYSHHSWGGASRITRVYGASFDLEFSGPDAEALNAIVSDQLVGGEAQLELYVRDARHLALVTCEELPRWMGLWDEVRKLMAPR